MMERHGWAGKIHKKATVEQRGALSIVAAVSHRGHRCSEIATDDMANNQDYTSIENTFVQILRPRAELFRVQRERER